MHESCKKERAQLRCFIQSIEEIGKGLMKDQEDYEINSSLFFLIFCASYSFGILFPLAAFRHGVSIDGISEGLIFSTVIFILLETAFTFYLIFARPKSFLTKG